MPSMREITYLCLPSSIRSLVCYCNRYDPVKEILSPTANRYTIFNNTLRSQVAERLNVDVRRGLSWREANDRMNFVGPNEFQVKEQEPLWKKYIEQFQNPLILLLLGKSCFSNFDITMV